MLQSSECKAVDVFSAVYYYLLLFTVSYLLKPLTANIFIFAWKMIKHNKVSYIPILKERPKSYTKMRPFDPITHSSVEIPKFK